MEADVRGRLHHARTYQLVHGHDWDVADVLPIVMDLLENAWNDGYNEAAAQRPRTNPYQD